MTARAAGELVGLVPASGEGRRLGRLPFSKELYPLPLGAGTDGVRAPRPVAEHLLGALARAGVARALIVLKASKWDVAAAFGSGAALGLDLGYLCLERTASVAHTLDRAHAHLRGARVVLGFPDIVFAPSDALVQLLAFSRRTGADVALALFPADRPDKCDRVLRDEEGRISGFRVKRAARGKGPFVTWALAVWTPAFTEFLHGWVRRGDGRRGRVREGGRERETSISDAIDAARRAGLHVEGLPIAGGWYLDVGTPDDLGRAVARLAGQAP